MSHQIEHSGVVQRVDKGHVQVLIVQTSACAACKVSGYCNAAESKEKLIDVYCDCATDYQVGQAVTVTASQRVAAKALLWGFGMPFVVMVAVLVAVLLLTGSEGVAALSGLLALLPYYGVLYLLRRRLRDQLSFAIK